MGGAPERPVRPRWVWLTLVVYGLHLVGFLGSMFWHVGQPLAGFVPHPEYPTELPLIAVPTSDAAAAIRDELGWMVWLHGINGESTCRDPDDPRHCGVNWARSLLDTRPGARNTFVVGAPGQPPRTVTLRAGPGSLRAVLSWSWQGLAMGLMGTIYVAIGLLVWLRRPRDPASLPLLLFAVALSGLLGGVMYVDRLTLVLSTLYFVPGALTMPFMFLLGHSFATQADASRTLRFRVQLVAALAVGTLASTAYMLTLSGVPAARPLLRAVPLLLTIGAVVAIALTLHSTWLASRPPSPLAHRRRAQVLGLAIALGFSFPTLWLMLQDRFRSSGLEPIAFWGMLLSFASFPALLGYAMVQHRMFDLRIVVRQGLLYTALSLSLTLAYVAVVVGAFKLVGVEYSTVASATAAGIIAVLVGVVRVRVERWIDAMVFRSRAVFRAAVQAAGQGLAQARKPSDIAPALAPSLIESLALARAYVGDAQSDYGRLDVYVVANQEDPETGRRPTEMPSSLGIARHGAIETALGTGAVMFSAQADLGSTEQLWERHGIEAIIPFGQHNGWSRGCLLLGPKRNGRPFDREDVALLQVLGGQVALALENAHTFKQLAESNRTMLSLTQGVVHEVNTPLGSLDASLDTLGRALRRLSEAEHDGERSRIVAGGSQVVENAQRSGARLRALIGDLKAYVNLEETERRPLDLADCLRQVVREQQSQATAPIRESPTEGPAWVDGYPAKLRHVLANIVDNAVMADADGEGVSVALEREQQSWVVTVRDRGEGMTRETLARIFDFGIAEKRREKRMGLRVGLPYAKRVVEELGGQIGIRSTRGEGTEVRLQLPACQPPDEQVIGMGGAASTLSR